MKKLLLVLPKVASVSYAEMRYVSGLTGRVGVMSATLPTLAASVPAEFEVRIVDENVEQIDYGQSYDLVGITGIVNQVHRARRIAESFRRRGATVVCGGPDASVAPERWRPFCDTLILGEADRIWPEFLADFLAGRHRPEYRELERFDLDVCRLPDYRGLSRKARESYLAGIVQTSRGCPFNCEFCDAVVYMGHRMRYKPVDLVVREVEQLWRMGYHLIILADDNFTAGRDRAKDVLRELRAWNRRHHNPLIFATQLSIDTARDEELLVLAAEAGLTRVLVGIESPNRDSLREVKKFQNVRTDMLRDVRAFHERGIQVIGTSIVGFDHDDLSVFQRHLDFFTAAGIINAQPFPLQAPDGTPLKQRIVREGRYIDRALRDDSESANVLNTFSVQPKQMSVDELRQGLHWLIWQLYRPERVAQRVRTFFAQFEASPKRRSLRMGKPHFGLDGLRVLARVLAYALARAPREERRALWDMLGQARRSSHSQAYAIAVGAFLSMKNSHGIMRVVSPEMDGTTCLAPARTQGAAGRRSADVLPSGPVQDPEAAGHAPSAPRRTEVAAASWDAGMVRGGATRIR